MRPSPKSPHSREDDQYDRARLAVSLAAVRDGLEELEAECADDVVLRDALAVACEAFHHRLVMIGQRCVSAERGG